MMSVTTQIICGVLGCLYLAWTCSALSFTFEVARRDEMCFYEAYNNQKQLEFRYEVIEGRAFQKCNFFLESKF